MRVPVLEAVEIDELEDGANALLSLARDGGRSRRSRPPSGAGRGRSPGRPSRPSAAPAGPTCRCRRRACRRPRPCPPRAPRSPRSGAAASSCRSRTGRAGRRTRRARRRAGRRRRPGRRRSASRRRGNRSSRTPCKGTLHDLRRRYGGLVPLAEIYPLVSSRSVARPFTYEVPDDVGVGAVVSIRFGRSAARGVVVATGVEAPAGVKTAPIESVLYELPPALVELALWLADYYGSTPARALELVAPKLRARRGERRATGAGMAGEAEPAALTPQQERAVARIVEAIDAGGAHLLLAGATGSGKTEVYLQACAAALARGKGAIVLVPEIALTPQTLGRFQARFGDRIAVLHSGLTEAERRDERERIVAGEAPVVVGARSAVFAPVPNLGLICVDEEHDSSYKQESDPRYDARTVAAKRAALEGAVAVYGSATPRPESWERLERLELGERLGAPMPSVQGRRPPPRGRLPALGAAARGARPDLGAGRQGDPAPQPPRPGARDPLPRLRCLAPVRALRRRADAARRLPPPLPPLRLLGGRPRSVSEVRLGRAGADRRRHAEARVGAREARPGARADPARRGHGREAGRAPRGARPLRRRRPRRPDRHADGREGPSLPRRLARGRRRRRHRARAARLPRRGAHVPARDPARRPQRPRRAREGDRPDLPAGRDAAALRGPPRRRRLPGGGARPPPRARLSAVPAPDLDRRLRARTPAARSGCCASSTASSKGADLLGPAPLLRLRGRHRAQLVAKTDSPRALAAAAGRLLAAAAPAMRRAGVNAVVDVDPQSL